MTDNKHFLQFQREKTGLKYFLIGRGYHLALKALGFVERYNVGLRKDGVTPSLHHEVQIALSVSQVKDVSREELCIVASLLHDVQEDHQIPSEDIEREFGKEVRDIVWKLTKKFSGQHKNKTDYIDEIALCDVCSIVKGLDRVNNLHSMIGVFSLEKMADYAKEAETVFLPMLKKAGKLFPEQQSAYHAISQQMKQAISFTRSYLSAIKDREEMILERDRKIEEKSDKIADRNVEILRLQEQLENSNKRNAELAQKLQEAGCDHRSSREAFIKSVKAVSSVLKTKDRENALAIHEALRKEFGISELELFSFDSRTTDPMDR